MILAMRITAVVAFVMAGRLSVPADSELPVISLLVAGSALLAMADSMSRARVKRDAQWEFQRAFRPARSADSVSRESLTGEEER